MKPVRPGEREIVNIHTAQFKPFGSANETADSGESYLQVDTSYPPGSGFHVYKMAPGTTTTAHEHRCNEQWLMLEGQLMDNDGTVYRQGDLVLMKEGTQHSSTTVDGCLLAVFIATPEQNLT